MTPSLAELEAAVRNALKTGWRGSTPALAALSLLVARAREMEEALRVVKVHLDHEQAEPSFMDVGAHVEWESLLYQTEQDAHDAIKAALSGAGREKPA